MRTAAFLISSVLFVLSVAGLRWSSPDRETGVFEGPPPTPFVHYQPVAPPAGEMRTALLVHGLNSNKEFMQTLSMALADTGVDTWAIDLPGHGSNRVGFDSESSQAAIITALEALPPDTVIIGHSLGAGLLADLSASREFSEAILLSPPPLPSAPVNIRRLLVITGRFDAPRIDSAIPGLIDRQGGDAEWWRLPWAAHSSSLFVPSQLRRVAGWITPNEAGVRAVERMVWLGLMVVGSIGLTTIAVRTLPVTRQPLFPAPAPLSPELIARVGALGLALVLLWMFNPLAWLRVFRTDYLMGVIAISGLLLWRGRRIPLRSSGILIACAGAAWVITLVVIVGSSFLHLIPEGGQWWRFPSLAALSLPLFVHDELTIRPHAGWRQAWGAFLLTRVLIWAAVITGVLLLNPESAFLVLIAHLVVLGWIPLWCLAGIVSKATGQPGAAALFASLVQGWVFSALFVTI